MGSGEDAIGEMMNLSVRGWNPSGWGQRLRWSRRFRWSRPSRVVGLGTLSVLALSLVFILGCGGDSSSDVSQSPVSGRPVGASGAGVRDVADRDDRIEVVATVGMVADVVRNVGGDHVRITQLMGAGVDPHLYRVTRDDVRAIFAADVVFSSGWMLEGKLSDALDRMAHRKVIEPLGEWVWKNSPMGQSLGSEVDAESMDPHVWMDIGLWAEGALRVAEVLGDRLPQHRDEFLRRASEYREELMDLDRWGREVMASIPPERRLLVTSHEAFGHFARAYQIEAMGVQGVATDSEAGLVRINRLVDQIVRRGVGAVFVESSVPHKSLEAVIEGASSRGHAVRIGGELYSDACGPEGTYEGTYVGMMDHNLTIVAGGLGGSVPPGGYRGAPSETAANDGRTTAGEGPVAQPAGPVAQGEGAVAAGQSAPDRAVLAGGVL